MVTKQEIIEAASELNYSGLAEKEVNVELKTTSLLRERFLEATESVPIEDEVRLPEIVVAVYNKIVEEEEHELLEEDLALANPKIEEMIRQESTPWRKGSGAQKVYEILQEVGPSGITIEAGLKIAENRNITSKNLRARIVTVWYTAIKRGLAEKINNRYRIKPKITS